MCKVNLNFLRSLGHCNSDTAFAVIVSLLSESNNGLNNIRNGRVYRVPDSDNLTFSKNIFMEKMNFLSVTFWYKDGYVFSEIAASPRYSVAPVKSL